MVLETDDFKIPDDKVKNAKEVFSTFDKRSQGKISATDLGTAFRALKVKFKPDSLKEWADMVDEEATGLIDIVGRPKTGRWNKFLVQKMVLETDDFKIPDDKVKNAKEVFSTFDKRSQGKISATDLGTAFRALKVKFKPDSLKEWADMVDEEATGLIDIVGFLAIYARVLMEEQDEHDLRDAFRILSREKGEIDVELIRWILKELGDDLTDAEIDDMIHDTDTDGSGFVDFDEFYKLMTSE